MSQKRMHSLGESVANTMAGFLVSVLAWEWIVKPVWDIETTMAENLQITALFTALSIVRGYGMRRLGNAVSVNAARATGARSAAGGRPQPPRFGPWPRLGPGVPYAHYLPPLDTSKRPCEHVWLQQLRMPNDPPAPRYTCSKCGSVWICGV